MTLHVIYESAAGVTTDLAATDHVRLPGFEVTANAEEGTVAQSQLLVDDEGGALDLVGLKRVWAWESAESAGNQVIWSGTFGDREIGRIAGGDEPFMVGADRRWSCALVESNAIAQRRVITGPDGDRPAETDIARLTWLLGSAYLTGVGDSLGYLDDTGAVDMDAADLRGQSAYDVISDCANSSNKDFFLVPVNASTTTGVSTYSLFYAYGYAAQYDSALRLTNVLADIDNSVTFAVDPDMILRRTPERVYSGVLVRYQGGEVYVQDTGTGNAFAFRDAVHPGVNVSTAAAATAKANRYLADADAEEDRITCSFTVPKEKVNGLREGQRVQIKFSHLPDYSAEYLYARCVRRIVRQQSDEHYRITVELTPFPAGTDTEIRLMRPNDDGPVSGGPLFHLHWDTNGDVPCCGSVDYPSFGLAEYVGAYGDQTGIRVLGDGLITVTLAASGISIVEDTVTDRIYVTVNGARVNGYQENTTTGGLRAQVSNFVDGTDGDLVVADIAVRNGDVIEAYWQFDATAIEPWAIPAGVGSNDQWLLVTGSLRA